MASKLLVNATAQACGLGRTSHADLGLRQSEHVQVGLVTPCVSNCLSTVLCRHGWSTDPVLRHHQNSLPASSSMGQPQQPGLLEGPVKDAWKNGCLCLRVHRVFSVLAERIRWACSGLRAQHSLPTDAGKLACVAQCLPVVLPHSPRASSKAMCTPVALKIPCPRLQSQPDITDMLQVNTPETLSLPACNSNLLHQTERILWRNS